jgi:serine phosphatase RsbU (regulator of sigma subunit)
VSEFVFRPLAIPFLCLAAGVLAMVIVVMLRRGDLPIRAGFISTGILGFTWSVGAAVVLCSTREPLAELFTRICAGAAAFVGPAMLLLFVALCGILTQLRRLLYGFGALAALVCVATWTTDLVITGMWQTAWGFWMPQAGVLFPLYFGVMALPVVVGAVLVHRIRHEHRHQPYRRYLTVAVAAMLLSFSDVLLYYRIGVYPFSVVPALVVVGFTLWSLFRSDLLYARDRGLDWGAMWELGLITLLVPMVAIGVWVAAKYDKGGGPWLAILLIVPLYGTMQAIILIVRSYLGSDGKPVLDSEAELALEEFGELVKEPRSEVAVGELLAELLGQHGQLAGAVLYIVQEGKGAWRSAAPGEPGGIAAPVLIERWLREQRRLVLRRELLIRRVGKLREALLEIFDRLAADVLIPLVERGKLVGVVAGKLPPDTRELDPRQLFLLRRATRTAARALIYLDLFRDAMERIEMARELEVAASSRVTREPGEQRHLYDLCEIIGYYHATRQMGGDFWTSYELDDGRVLVVMGGVAEHGMPTALVSATVAGACETALHVRGTSVDLVELMTLLDQAVRSVGGERRYDMGCFAALFEDGRVSFASAGHPGSWLCRRSMTGRRDDELHLLETGGQRLGSAAGVTADSIRAASLELMWNDIVVMCSEPLVCAPSPEGEPYGERRLPRLLRRQARASGGRLCRVILDDLLTHGGDQPLSEDFSLVVVRMGAGRSHRRARTTDATADMRTD